MPSRYTLQALRRHTRSIRELTEPLVKRHWPKLNGVVVEFDAYFLALDAEPDQLRANVQKVLATKFLNHWYSAFLLCEAGLMVDVILCERSAIETMAYHWLVLLDPSVAAAYQSGQELRPVDVRKRLETLGADISFIRSTYSSGSDISHVGRDSERFHLSWGSEKHGTLFIGGQFVERDAEHWLTYLPALLTLFMEPLMAKAAP